MKKKLMESFGYKVGKNSFKKIVRLIGGPKLNWISVKNHLYYVLKSIILQNVGPDLDSNRVTL